MCVLTLLTIILKLFSEPSQDIGESPSQDLETSYTPPDTTSSQIYLSTQTFTQTGSQVEQLATDSTTSTVQTLLKHSPTQAFRPTSTVQTLLKHSPSQAFRTTSTVQTLLKHSPTQAVRPVSTDYHTDPNFHESENSSRSLNKTDHKMQTLRAVSTSSSSYELKPSSLLNNNNKSHHDKTEPTVVSQTVPSSDLFINDEDMLVKTKMDRVNDLQQVKSKSVYNDFSSKTNNSDRTRDYYHKYTNGPTKRLTLQLKPRVSKSIGSKSDFVFPFHTTEKQFQSEGRAATNTDIWNSFTSKDSSPETSSDRDDIAMLSDDPWLFKPTVSSDKNTLTNSAEIHKKGSQNIHSPDTKMYVKGNYWSSILAPVGTKHYDALFNTKEQDIRKGKQETAAPLTKGYTSYETAGGVNSIKTTIPGVTVDEPTRKTVHGLQVNASKSVHPVGPKDEPGTENDAGIGTVHEHDTLGIGVYGDDVDSQDGTVQSIQVKSTPKIIHDTEVGEREQPVVHDGIMKGTPETVHGVRDEYASGEVYDAQADDRPRTTIHDAEVYETEGKTENLEHVFDFADSTTAQGVEGYGNGETARGIGDTSVGDAGSTIRVHGDGGDRVSSTATVYEVDTTSDTKYTEPKQIFTTSYMTSFSTVKPSYQGRTDMFVSSPFTVAQNFKKETKHLGEMIQNGKQNHVALSETTDSIKTNVNSYASSGGQSNSVTSRNSVKYPSETTNTDGDGSLISVTANIINDHSSHSNTVSETMPRFMFLKSVPPYEHYRNPEVPAASMERINEFNKRVKEYLNSMRRLMKNKNIYDKITSKTYQNVPELETKSTENTSFQEMNSKSSTGHPFTSDENRVESKTRESSLNHVSPRFLHTSNISLEPNVNEIPTDEPFQMSDPSTKSIHYSSFQKREKASKSTLSVNKEPSHTSSVWNPQLRLDADSNGKEIGDHGVTTSNEATGYNLNGHDDEGVGHHGTTFRNGDGSFGGIGDDAVTAANSVNLDTVDSITAKHLDVESPHVQLPENTNKHATTDNNNSDTSFADTSSQGQEIATTPEMSLGPSSAIAKTVSSTDMDMTHEMNFLKRLLDDDSYVKTSYSPGTSQLENHDKFVDSDTNQSVTDEREVNTFHDPLHKLSNKISTTKPTTVQSTKHHTKPNESKIVELTTFKTEELTNSETSELPTTEPSSVSNGADLTRLARTSQIRDRTSNEFNNYKEWKQTSIPIATNRPRVEDISHRTTSRPSIELNIHGHFKPTSMPPTTNHRKENEDFFQENENRKSTGVKEQTKTSSLPINSRRGIDDFLQYPIPGERVLTPAPTSTTVIPKKLELEDFLLSFIFDSDGLDILSQDVAEQIKRGKKRKGFFIKVLQLFKLICL